MHQADGLEQREMAQRNKFEQYISRSQFWISAKVIAAPIPGTPCNAHGSGRGLWQTLRVEARTSLVILPQFGHRVLRFGPSEAAHNVEIAVV